MCVFVSSVFVCFCEECVCVTVSSVCVWGGVFVCVVCVVCVCVCNCEYSVYLIVLDIEAA